MEWDTVPYIIKDTLLVLFLNAIKEIKLHSETKFTLK